MSVISVIAEPGTQNPLDILEEVVTANDWSWQRPGTHEFALQINGSWCDYRLYFYWQEELGALHFSCVFETRVAENQSHEVYRLMVLINEKLWLGHFELSHPEGTLLFRHTMILRGAGPVATEQLEDLLDVAITDSDRFFPAFQFVLWGGKSAEEALDAALIDVAGTA